MSGLRDDESVYRGGLSSVILRSLEKKADELLAAYGLILDPSSNMQIPTKSPADSEMMSPGDPR